MMLTPSNYFPNQTNFDAVHQAIRGLHHQIDIVDSAEERRKLQFILRACEEWIIFARKSPCLRTLVTIQPTQLDTGDPNAKQALWKADLVVDGVLKRRRCFRLGTEDVFVKVRTIRDGLVLGSVDEFVMGRLSSSNPQEFIPNEPRQCFAVKNFMKAKIGTTQENMERELTIQWRLTELESPYLLKLLAFMGVDDRYMALLPLITKGDLFDCLMHIDLKQIRTFMVSMLKGVRAIHALGICHRDISPENFLVQDAETTLLMDFGLATEMDENWMVSPTGFVGKRSYAPPELWDDLRPYDGRKVDVWCLGVSFVVMITKRFPWEYSRMSRFKNIMANLTVFLNEAFAPIRNPVLVDLIGCMLRMNPAERPRVDELLEHAFFRET